MRTLADSFFKRVGHLKNSCDRPIEWGAAAVLEEAAAMLEVAAMLDLG